jgi:hypothetical protein
MRLIPFYLDTLKIRSIQIYCQSLPELTCVNIARQFFTAKDEGNESPAFAQNWIWATGTVS